MGLLFDVVIFVWFLCVLFVGLGVVGWFGFCLLMFWVGFDLYVSCSNSLSGITMFG